MIELRRQQHIEKKLGMDREEGAEDTVPQVVKRGPGRPPKKAIDPSEIGS